MKLVSTILGLVLFSSTVFAANAKNCEAIAKDAATVFQNQIVKEMVVDSKYTEVTSATLNEDEIVYSISMSNQDGSRMRDTTVKTDLTCNVQSTARE